jgi:mRNA-degrading endonuclease RelE of RelBE toxin-antitoxin system
VKFETLPLFDKQFKKLAKKYSLIKDDIESFIYNFDSLHQQAISIKNNIYKIRVSNSNKNKGKSAGYRVYYYVKVDEMVYLITIYDKSEIQMINESIVTNAIKNIDMS